MTISYGKLWQLVKDNKLRKGDLARAAHLTAHTMRKLNNDEPVHLEILLRLCGIFHCGIGDLVDVYEH